MKFTLFILVTCLVFDMYFAEIVHRRAYNSGIRRISVPKICEAKYVFSPVLVLINVVSGNLTKALGPSSIIRIENKTQPGEQDEPCLLKHMRQDITGYKGVSIVQVPYNKCGVTMDPLRYIVLEYTCVYASPTLDTPFCSGHAHGSQIRIQSADYNQTATIPSDSNCHCSITTLAHVLQITTYYTSLTEKQSVTIADSHGVVFKSIPIPDDKVKNVASVNVSGELLLTWSNNETQTNNGSKFWIEVEANGTDIDINCEHLTTIATTSQTFEYSSTNGAVTPVNLTDIHTQTTKFTKPGSDITSDTSTSTVETSTFPTSSYLQAKSTVGSASPSTPAVKYRSTATDVSSHKPATDVLSHPPAQNTSYTTTAAPSASSSTHAVDYRSTTTNVSSHRPATDVLSHKPAQDTFYTTTAAPSADGGGFPLIPVIVGIILFLILVICTCIVIIILGKRHRNKQQEKSQNNDQDAGEGEEIDNTTTDGQKDDFQAGDEPVTPLVFAPMSRETASPIGNTSFIPNRLPPIATLSLHRNHGSIEGPQDDNVEYGESGELVETKKKKKKKKKKRKKGNKVHPESEVGEDNAYNEDGTVKDSWESELHFNDREEIDI